MKIGIISCDGWLRLWDNYGTLFQNYALQTHLRRLGHETFWIMTGHASAPLRERLARVVAQPRKLLAFAKSQAISRTIGARERRKIKAFNAEHPRNFPAFFEQNIPHTSRRYTAQDLKNLPPEANAYIVGSDQVWGSVSTTTFLDFGDASVRRIAYAASTAWSTRSREWLDAATQKLPRFDAVSVREPEGVVVCARAGRKDVRHVCDPTLLLERNDYMQLVRAAGDDRPFPRKTVLAYFLNVKKLSALPWREVVNFAREREAELKVVPLQGSELAVPEANVFTPSPTQWLNAYDKADCVLTNSFHGTAFAVIMRKPFLVVLQCGKTESENCRFFSILKKLGLENRILTPSDVRNGGGYTQKWTRRSTGTRSNQGLRNSVRNLRNSSRVRSRRGRKNFFITKTTKLVGISFPTGFFAFPRTGTAS